MIMEYLKNNFYKIVNGNLYIMFFNSELPLRLATMASLWKVCFRKITLFPRVSPLALIPLPCMGVGNTFTLLDTLNILRKQGLLFATPYIQLSK
jgi:hypothetical protein